MLTQTNTFSVPVLECFSKHNVSLPNFVLNFFRPDLTYEAKPLRPAEPNACTEVLSQYDHTKYFNFISIINLRFICCLIFLA